MHTRGAKNKRHYTLALLLIGLTIILSAVLMAIHGGHRSPTRQLTPAAPHKPATVHKVTANYGLPVRLQIPTLKVDTHVIYVGLTKDGNMSVPTNIIDVGWYKYGALPGNTGTAVIAGHLDGLRGQPGVFSNLSKLVPGDVITVTESNGSTISFVVREKRNYPQTEQPEEVFSSTSGSHLNLITCTGSWDSTERRFAERLVVFTDKAS